MTSLCCHLSAQEIVNWVTTADGCVHTADADATKQFRRVGVGGVYWALDCDQSNYSSSVVSSHISIEFGPTGNSAIRSADLENPTVEPNVE